MTHAVHIRMATPADDAALRALARRIVMPGGLGVAFTREPQFFDALAVEGHAHITIVGDCAGELVGYGVASARDVLINGATHRLGYLSGLRLLPAYRGGLLVARGYQQLRACAATQLGVTQFLSTIMEDNLPARALLTSGRAGLPQYHDIGRYLTYVLPARSRPAPAPRHDLLSGTAVGATALAAALRALGSRRHFFPAYQAADFDAGMLLRGLPLEQFVVATHASAILGVAACWDVAPFRQTVVTGYHGLWRALRPCYNAWARLRGGGRLPAPRQPAAVAYAACIAVQNDNHTVFTALLARLLDLARAAHKEFLLIGLAETDPLTPLLRRRATLRLRSRMYIVTWDDPRALAPPPDRPCYLELASL